MQLAPKSVRGTPANPELDNSSLQSWQEKIPVLKETFQNEIYGKVPTPTIVGQPVIRLVSESEFNASARIEEWTINFINSYDGEQIGSQHSFKMVLATSLNETGPKPVIMMQNFCPNYNVIPIAGITRPSGDHFSCPKDGLGANIMTYFFGRYITTPPIEDIVNRGYALAVVFPPDYIADSSGLALQQLEASLPDSYAIAAWAGLFSAMTDALDLDNRFSDTVAHGHSRYGKSALLAAAFDSDIDGVIAHQSGTGGASLNSRKKGETVAAITESYPHWFSPNYVEDELSVDQHQLLALIAPRPILLGNARRDVWSDPEGAFRAALGANPIYKLYGSGGLTQPDLKSFYPEADIAFWMRPGTHGVVKEDWPAFLDFMDAHFK